MPHDYDPEWDYVINRRPDKAVKLAINATLNSFLISALLQELSLAVPTIYYVKNLASEGVVARYISGTRDEPVIVVDDSSLNKLCRKRQCSLQDEVEITILHELGHAYLDAALTEEERENLPDEEDLVERFAQRAWLGDVEGAVKILTSGT